MKLKDLYLEAARRVAEGEESYSCHAVGATADSVHWPDIEAETIPQVQRYCRIFGPDGRFYGFVSAMLNVCSSSKLGIDYTEARNLRVLMLCLMAECWKDFR